VYAPPVVGENVEHAQNEDKECSRPFRFESNGDHGTSPESNDGDKYANESPLSLKDKSNKEENEEHTSGEKEVFLSIGFADAWQTSKELFASDHGITENHKEATDDTEVTQEEIEVENKTVAKALDNNHSQETSNSIFTVTFKNDGR